MKLVANIKLTPTSEEANVLCRTASRPRSLDLGIVNLATDRDGRHDTGEKVEKVRQTQSSQALWKTTKVPEARRRRLLEAQRSGRGIGLEDQAFANGSRPAVPTRSAWQLVRQLPTFVAYKDRRAGTLVLFSKGARVG
jgi:hypothetical protein